MHRHPGAPEYVRLLVVHRRGRLTREKLALIIPPSLPDVADLKFPTFVVALDPFVIGDRSYAEGRRHKSQRKNY